MEALGVAAQTVTRAIWIALFTDWVIEILLLRRDREYLVRTRNLWKCRLFGIFVVAVFAATFSSMATQPLPRFAHSVLTTGGMFVFVLGAALHVGSRLYLGKNWSSEARVRPGHRLIRHGPYALVRHPVYLSEILMAFGTAMVFENWLALLVALVLVWTAVYQARIEERLLHKQFGVEVEAYRRTTPMLFPTVRSLKAGARELLRSRKRITPRGGLR
ncbi:MAG: isoprenylcysteine carboxylmethyltransferase family protein [Chloroflexi bacterium]|nr:isoprenylcysteine carboxylmethyltransferase family protein [Chloroflexota bacterium]